MMRMKMMEMDALLLVKKKMVGYVIVGWVLKLNNVELPVEMDSKSE
jgi:hypothetical protein